MSKIKLEGVRLSFPSLFKRAKFNDVEGKFEATLLIPKSDTKTKQMLDKAIAEITPKNVKVKAANIALRDGDEVEYDGYADHWSLKASNSKRPTIINRDKSQLTEDDEVLFAGCIVNAIVDFWFQDNQYGRRVNANLYGVQFVRDDGVVFGHGPVDVTDDFDEVDEEEDEL